MYNLKKILSNRDNYLYERSILGNSPVCFNGDSGSLIKKSCIPICIEPADPRLQSAFNADWRRGSHRTSDSMRIGDGGRIESVATNRLSADSTNSMRIGNRIQMGKVPFERRHKSFERIEIEWNEKRSKQGMSRRAEQ